ncbi:MULTISPECIES: hypothetical protein [unclassified Rhizobium]|uniref:hypothetical protein n=1 Tax=unclassified Rhizobium TaxID=2613769 RepID=UPI000CDF4043|nr:MULTISPECIES: hypothetical protein [Rhizobium]AVA23122.1 hypothetical protein NXC24_CH03501 [Rhizobium sp. NXC24]UWU20481.1 hypothetical protein N2601_14485 [Rhizobium tropici]
MTERATTAYRRLFEVRLLHHYWLDEGARIFDNLPAVGWQARLLAYDVRSFLEIRPTQSTGNLLRGLGCIFRPTSLGFVVAAPKAAAIDQTTALSFAVSVIDSDFFDYTALTLLPRKIYELSDPTDNTPDRATYRFKENVSVLSNLTGAMRGSGVNATLFLSRETPAPDATDRVEALVKSGTKLMQLTSDNPGATKQQLGTLTGLPLYVNQADAPPIVAPAGISGAPARGVALLDDVPDDVFLLIRLGAVRADNGAFSFVDGNGAPKVTPPVYQVRFKNRATFWSYRKKKDDSITVEPDALPLTHFGNAGTRQKPSGTVRAEQSGTKITRLVSDIYV